jgi:hypothetical protein
LCFCGNIAAVKSGEKGGRWPANDNVLPDYYSRTYASGTTNKYKRAIAAASACESLRLIRDLLPRTCDLDHIGSAMAAAHCDQQDGFAAAARTEC